MPIGFIAGQLQSERAQAARRGPTTLPSGFVTLLMTDIEGSTAIVQHVGPDYSRLIEELWSTLRSCANASGGHEVEARADEFFAAFESPRDAVDAAIAVQRALPERVWPGGADGPGPHRDPQRLSDVDADQLRRHRRQHDVTDLRPRPRRPDRRVGEHPGGRQGVGADGVRFTALGSHHLRGVTAPVALYQVGAKGLRGRFPPLRTG